MKNKELSCFCYWLLSFLLLFLNILLVYVIFNSSRFSVISQHLFIKATLFCILLLIFIDIIVILLLYKRNIKFIFIANIILAMIIVAVFYSTLILNRINHDINKITDNTLESNIQVAFVVYDEAKEKLKDEKDIANHKVGYVVNTDISTAGKERLINDGINADYQEYENITELLSALITQKVDVAILPGNYKGQAGNDEKLVAKLEKTHIIFSFSKNLTKRLENAVSKDITKEPFTVLLTGENEGLADTIILASINPVSMKVILTSIARDSYVPISCNRNARDKINAAHVYSEACMVKTVENLTNIKIDYTAQFNFASVIQIVDAIGGVDMNVEATFVAQSWDVATNKLVAYYLHKGQQHLSGQDALGYVRERHAFPDGDFARQRHQQELISLVMKKLTESKDINTLLKVLDAAGNNLNTNLSVQQMLSFLRHIKQKGGRFYNSQNPSGVINMYSSRITGYSSTVYNAQLGLDLWIYPLYKGSINDIRKAHEENLDLKREIKFPEYWQWSINKPYKRPDISKEVYAESKIQTAKRPVTNTVKENEKKENDTQLKVPKIDSKQNDNLHAEVNKDKDKNKNKDKKISKRKD